ncbi:B3 domain-containing transcription factor LEC2 [Punica granatum]|uniref:B3 domain-containing transcription factor LEC2 n=1 Tax=Punica granatum TaxID=22663 RepID=A0A6P8DIE8_PUNGR|nr:B3 domain-containing transcription factor LEC2 [Punica granatum]
MEKPYFPFPNTTNEEPYTASSQPQPHPHSSSSSSYDQHHHPYSSLSSSTSTFPYHHPAPFPSPYLPMVPPFAVHPPTSQPPTEPFWVGPKVQHPVSYSGQPVHRFSGIALSQPNYTNFNTSTMSPVDQERMAAADAWTTKVARTKRKIARQRSLNLNRSSEDLAAMFPHFYYDGVDDATTVLSMHETMASSAYKKPIDPYNFISPDNKRLRLILKKELKNSDVGSLGRIVIPKRDAEENLPSLNAKEGIQVVIKDINSHQEWSLRYKFWSNNKSRMYVLENTGDFVKKNELEIGDTVILYEDKSHNFYFSIKKAEKPLQELLQKPHQNPNRHYSSFQIAPTTSPSHEEEDAALALLIEQLGHREQQEVTLHLMDFPPPSSQYMAPANEPQAAFNCFTKQDNNNQRSDNNTGIHSNDFYSSFDSLNGINPCTFPFLDQWSGARGENQQ